jgi:hypothetical protein
MLEAEQSELLLIKAENEKLQEGTVPPVMITDDHRLHILEHKAVLADPDVRNDPQLVQSVTNHMQQHVEVWRQADPIILQALQQQPLGPPPGQQPPPQEQGPPEGGGAPMQPNESPQEQVPDMPQMPEVPEGTPPEMADAYSQMQGNIEGPQ